MLCFLREIYERRRLVRFKLNSIFCAARADAASAALAASAVLLQHATWVWGSNNNKLLNNKVFCCYSLLTVAFYGAAHFIRFSSLRFASFYFACFLFSPSRPFPLFLFFCAFSLKIDFPFTSFNGEGGGGTKGVWVGAQEVWKATTLSLSSGHCQMDNWVVLFVVVVLVVVKVVVFLLLLATVVVVLLVVVACVV